MLIRLSLKRPTRALIDPHQKRTRRRLTRAGGAVIESLESRVLMSADVLSFHYDAGSTGQQLSETVLTPSNVNPGSFGKQFTTRLDGQVYAQPLARANVRITTGSSPGMHNVVFAATQHDSLYAVDANTGAILWHDSFLNPSNPQSGFAAGGVSTVSEAATQTDDIGPEIGIVSTPVVSPSPRDPATGTIYAVAKTTELRRNTAGGTDTHYVQRLWAVNISDGSPMVAPAVIGDTILDGNVASYAGYQYVGGPVVQGTGNNNPRVPGIGVGTADADGWIPNAAGFNPAKSGQIAFNALLQMNRTGLTLLNGVVYMGFASHGDNGPYYGWVMGFNASNLSLAAAFVTTPNFRGIHGSADYPATGGVWMTGNSITTDGTYLYLNVGNGTFDVSASNFSGNYFTSDNGHTVLLPTDNNYADTVLKLAFDPNANQHGVNNAPAYNPDAYDPNGFGLRVVDYFAPSNSAELNINDEDLGSGGITLLPNNVTAPNGDPMLVASSKEGRMYLLDRNNLGGFNTAYPSANADPSPYDRVLGEFSNSGTVNSQNFPIFSTTSYFNGQIFVTPEFKPARAFALSSFIAGRVPPGTASSAQITGQTADVFRGRGGTEAISANGPSNGILWQIDPRRSSSDDLLAYSTADFRAFNYSIAPIYDSNGASNYARDALTGLAPGATGVKFSVPTIFNGMVYAGTGGGNTSAQGTLVGYGLLNSYLQSNGGFLGAPAALNARFIAGGAQLSWLRRSTLETETEIDRSTDGVNWAVLAYVPNGASSYQDLSAGATSYFYRVRAISGASGSAFSNVARPGSVTPTGGTITGLVYDDANSDNRFDSGDSALANWRVYLDLNGNGIFDAGEPSALTDASGNYSLSGVTPGSYTLRVATPSGWRVTLPAGPSAFYSITVTSGQTLNRPFGFTELGYASGTVFNDVNGNGMRDIGEPGLAGWRVFFDPTGTGVFSTTDPSALTDSRGNWWIGNLPAGNYLVRVLAPSGWANTVPVGGSYLARVGHGFIREGLVFGEHQGAATALRATLAESALATTLLKQKVQ